MRSATAPLPESVAAYLATIHNEPRQSPEASPDRLNGDINDAVSAYNRLSRGCSQAHLALFFHEHIFSGKSPAKAAQIKNSWSALLAPHLATVCSADGLPLITTPSPQLLCGYSTSLADGAFSRRHVAAQDQLRPSIPHYTLANSQGLSFPFLAAEFTASGLPRSGNTGTGESLGQCAVACTAGLRMARRLNKVARRCQEQRKNEGLSSIGALECVPEICHGVIVNQNTADLYVAWVEEPSTDVRAAKPVYVVQRTARYLLSKPEYMKQFRQHVHNIVAWGIHERLSTVRALLDVIG